MATMIQAIRMALHVGEERLGVTDIFGLGITEHLPWDALALRDILRRLPLLGSGAAKAVS